LVMEPSLELNETTSAVIGAAMEVHRVLGPGFVENVYEEAMAVELGLRGISFSRQAPVAVTYKEQSVGEGRVDLYVEKTLVVELKAVEKLLPVHQAQVLSYLKASGCHLGLLINFHERLLKDGIRRVVLTSQ
jgi:GxxExxY protein